MWDLDHHSLPDSLASMFTRRDEIHNRNLRDKTKINSTPRIVLIIEMDMTRSHTADLFLLNKLKDLSFYGNCYSKSAFMAKYKASMLDTY